MAGLTVYRQVNAVIVADPLQILGEQVAKIHFYAAACKIRTNGAASVSGADDGNFHIHKNLLQSKPQCLKGICPAAIFSQRGT